MAVKFLSEDWASAVDSALADHAGFKSAIANAELGLQFETKNGPDGDVAYFLKASGGNADFELGSLDEPDVSVTAGYDTAAGISKGDVNVQTAFMTGKLKVSGNLAKLMMHQNAIQQWQAAVRTLDVDY